MFKNLNGYLLLTDNIVGTLQYTIWYHISISCLTNARVHLVKKSAVCCLLSNHILMNYSHTFKYHNIMYQIIKPPNKQLVKV